MDNRKEKLGAILLGLGFILLLGSVGGMDHGTPVLEGVFNSIVSLGISGLGIAFLQ